MRARRETDAEFLAIFDSDFVPPKDYLAAHHSALLPGRRRARRRACARAGAVGPSEPRRVILDARPVAVGRRPPHVADVLALRRVAVRELHRYGRGLAGLGDRGCRRLALREPRGRLRAELSAPVRRLPHEVRQGDRRARRASGDLHRLQGAAEALDAGMGAAAEDAPRHASVPIPVLLAPPDSPRLPHVHLVAVAPVGDLAH